MTSPGRGGVVLLCGETPQGHLSADGLNCVCVCVCSQLVWATSNKIGCAINVCYNMNVWGMIWAKAVYLVCNYSPP